MNNSFARWVNLNKIDDINNFIKTKRKNVLILRYIGSIFVICFHLRWVLANNTQQNSISYSIIEVLTLIAVNVFIMCTALSSFNKTKNNYKHWFKMIAILYLWNWLLVIIGCIRWGWEGNNLKYIFLPFLFGTGWYLIVYIFFYPLIPLLNSAIKNKRNSLIFTIFYILIGITQIFKIEYFEIGNLHIINFIFLYLFTRSVIILIYEYLIKNPITVMLISLCLYITLLITNVLTTYYVKSDIFYSHLPSITLAITFFIFFLTFKINDNKFSKLFCFLGSNSLYFYIFDNIYIQFKIPIIWNNELTYFVGAIVQISIITIAIIILHYSRKIINLLRKMVLKIRN